jgi:DNA primase
MTDLLLDPATDDQNLLAQVVSYYHESLKNSTEALDYLRKRGITNGEALTQFRLGYSDRTLGLKLPVKQVKAGRLIRERLQRLGLYRESGHEHFSGCVTFPVFAADGSGRIVDLYGRKTGGIHLRKGTPLDMYLGNERKGVWNVEAVSASEEMILCPSVVDALTFWNHGYRNVTCTFGPDALTQDHLHVFTEFKVKRVLVVDLNMVQKLLDAGLDVYSLQLPPTLSISTYALQAGDPAEALGALLRTAHWFGKGQAIPMTTVPVNTTPAPMPTPAVNQDMVEQDEQQDDDDDQEDDDELDDADELAKLEDEEDEPEPTIPLMTSNPLPRLASPLPPAPPSLEAEVDADEVRLTFGNRRYRIRGLSKNLAFDVLKVNVLVSNDVGLFVDSFDLYSAKHRRSFVVQAAAELHVEEQTLKNDLGRVLLKLEELQDKNITEQLKPKDTTPRMTDTEKQDALQLLRDPRLLDRIVADFHIVGEASNKLIGYLAAISRKLDEPLAIVIQSTSAAGKSTLMDAVLALVPPEDVVQFSAMTGQALYYMGEGDLKHKILAVVEEEGAAKASYALKLLQSEGHLTIASTGKEANTGRLVTQTYKVEGPVMLFLTTTSVQVDEELLNRCLILSVNEDRDQTKAIHQAQRQKQTLVGLLAKQEQHDRLKLHRNAQRLLKPLLVANPYAEHLTFLDDKTRTRRDHAKYLTLIRAVALLHQHQRPIQTIEHQGKTIEYIEVTPDDIAIANTLTHEVLGRSLDELPPQTRRLLDLIDSMVSQACQQQGLDRSDYRFSRRDVREHTQWGHSQLAVHLRRLEELEYLIVHRGQRGRSFVYELAYSNPSNDTGRFLAGLTDAHELRRHLPAPGNDLPASFRPHSGQLPAHFRPTENDPSPAPPSSNGTPCPS